MHIELGTLRFTAARERPDLLSEPVNRAIAHSQDADKIGVSEIDASLSDTAAFCDHYRIPIDVAANCVVLEAKRGDRSWFAACVILGNTRADVNGLARRTLDAKKASFAAMEQAVAQTGMEYGAITPIGLPDSWPILVDKAVGDSTYVIIGSGLRKSKLALPGLVLASMPNAQVLDGLGR